VIDPATAADSLRVLDHHGPEVFPFVEALAGGGLSLAAGLVIARWRSLTTRFRGGSDGQLRSTSSRREGRQQLEPHATRDNLLRVTR
jgi:hypothetical protein